MSWEFSRHTRNWRMGGIVSQGEVTLWYEEIGLLGESRQFLPWVHAVGSSIASRTSLVKWTFLFFFSIFTDPTPHPYVALPTLGFLSLPSGVSFWCVAASLCWHADLGLVQLSIFHSELRAMSDPDEVLWPEKSSSESQPTIPALCEILGNDSPSLRNLSVRKFRATPFLLLLNKRNWMVHG